MNKLVLIIVTVLTVLSCKSDENSNINSSPNNSIDYSTQSDSARYYYDLGWQQIMDEGFYGPSEQSYRKSLEHDPNFLLSAGTLARLTLDLDERKDLLQKILKGKYAIKGDERLVLEVYQSFTELTNARQEKDPKTDRIRAAALQLAIDNFGAVVPKRPQETYLFAEYIEIIHALQGPQPALDSLDYYIKTGHQSNIFLAGYRASMLAEQGQFSDALIIADDLAQQLDPQTYPKPNAVYADIYYQQKEYLKALPYAQKGSQLDPRNLDLSRLLTKIEGELKK